MAFYKKIRQKINGKWYPQAVTAAGTMTTDEVAERLSDVLLEYICDYLQVYVLCVA
jgi:hypothetical protein